MEEEIPIIMDSDEIVDCILIKPSKINDISWTDPNYSKKIMELDAFEIIKVTKDNFLKSISEKLEINKYKMENIAVKNEYIGDEPNYLYEMMYVELINNDDYVTDDNFNEIATLFNLVDEKIYSTAIVFKNYIPSLVESMNLSSISKKDLETILYDRVYTKVVLWNDDKWYEDRAVGDLELYANTFFEGDNFHKMEIAFLMHNINIWFTSDYGEPDICGKLINKPIEKCIWFTMKTDELRGNLTLDEVKKIIYLSNVLNSYLTPKEYYEEKHDSNGREINYNKYQVLDQIYSLNKK